MLDNPYSAPVDLTNDTGLDNNESVSSLAKKIFLSWEKLRIIYVAILVVSSVAVIGVIGSHTPRLVLILIEGAVGANLLYFAGPIVETYINWLGYRKLWPRWFLFVGGTCLSILLTISVLYQELVLS